MGRQIIITDKFRYDTENGNRIYEAIEIEVPKKFKRKTANLVPYYVEFELYNTGGFTERKQIGYECSKCKNKYDFAHSSIKYCAKCGAKIIEPQESEEDADSN